MRRRPSRALGERGRDMKRIRLIGLCLVVAVAVVAVAATSASAAEYGQCRELNKNTTPKVKHGKYEDSNCQKLYMKKGKVEEKGNFEWYGGPPANCIPLKKGNYTESKCEKEAEKKGKPVEHKGTYERQACSPNCDKYTPSVTGSITLPYVECNAAVAGPLAPDELTGPKTGVEDLVFTGCHEEAFPCQNFLGPKEVEDNATITELLEPGPGKVNTNVIPVTPIYTIVYCESGYEYTVEGSLEGETASDVNVMNSVSKTVFGTAPQALIVKEYYKGVFSFEYPITVSLTEQDTFAESVEIKAP